MTEDRDLNRQPRTPRATLALLGFFAAFGVGACFEGADAQGLPCANNDQCGVGQSCVDGFCGGVFRCADGVTLISTSKVCDFFDDCPDASDEDPDLCAGGGEQFPCNNGGEVPWEFTCDGEDDCGDGSDEDPEMCAGVGVNMCTDSDGDLWWEVGAVGPAPGMPAHLEVVNIVGSNEPDVIMLSQDGLQGGIVTFDPMSGTAMNFPLSDISSNAKILDFELANLGTEMMGPREDVVFAVLADAPQLLVVDNNQASNAPPSLRGSPIPITIGLGDPDVKGIEIGRFDNQGGDDVAVIMDGVVKGRLITAIGDPGGDNYFTFEMAMLGDTDRIPYDAFLDSGRTNVDGDMLEDLIVSGMSGGMGMLYVIRRTGVDLSFASWTIMTIELERPAVRFTLGRFDAEIPAEGILAIDPDMGELRTYVNMGMGNFEQEAVISVGQPTGAGMGDVNCDDRADFLVNTVSTNEVLVFLGDGSGGVFDDVPIRIPMDGLPRGQLATTNFDGNNAVDIFAMVDTGNGVPNPELHVLLANYLDLGESAAGSSLRASP